ncbi:ion transporter [Roseospira visakhapatnamensis]|uniref:Voltage-gated sodium channel n=1 Tax=Roseospira visakhapatnamensis TaxID=390880 RepID=A0A7W6W972_9PROT|nr:ion transporter [Roseospira visakhapatnamensis]MBB4265176.1 voltage-gated sodium channel [Roseospira visakhapatnamensis]
MSTETGVVLAEGWRGRVGRLVEGGPFQRLIMALIVLNAVTLGLETSARAMAAAGPVLTAIDKVVLGVFVVEIAGKLWYRRLSFFRNGWNVFDFTIVGIALVPATGPLAVLRALRILRVLRLISVVPQMRRVVGALLTAIPGLLSVGAIIALVFYVGAVLSTKLFGASFPDWFGTIGASMYTLFQIMTLESWSMGIVRPVMEAYPLSWLFFVPFIVATSFAILNLFIGIIVDSMQMVHQREKEEDDRAQAALTAAEGGPPADPVLAEVRALRDEVAALRRLLEPGAARGGNDDAAA